mmetsp:Transcript_5625/g.13024  ORF Transcript_5625/g.13024 Transcript_5625/m.13024 type:complete len:259 (-) Transcript_5625:345-1121(-)
MRREVSVHERMVPSAQPPYTALPSTASAYTSEPVGKVRHVSKTGDSVSQKQRYLPTEAEMSSRPTETRATTGPYASTLRMRTPCSITPAASAVLGPERFHTARAPSSPPEKRIASGRQEASSELGGHRNRAALSTLASDEAASARTPDAAVSVALGVLEVLPLRASHSLICPSLEAEMSVSRWMTIEVMLERCLPSFLVSRAALRCELDACAASEAGMAPLRPKLVDGGGPADGSLASKICPSAIPKKALTPVPWLKR